ncbi:calcium-binding protein [Sphingomonas sp. SUN039]|uniref:calcium-binding protein n=1 Tax=Sphingomonas sp. SUN039 TaxID=2937787 RepID=UPI0021642744|nr:calcium-binding protein [Sphingomonas sp. SUN039]UVO52933.1 hypothetical protein M0209_01900 [Sphingomonas sp. SUN039]
MTDITGTGGADKLQGSTGDDIIHGLAGDDIVAGDFGNDDIFGDEGDDTLDGDRGTDRLYGGAGNDTLYSRGIDNSGTPDFMYGEDGDDSLIASGASSVTMDGGVGNDRFIISSSGSTTALGGDGIDQFAFYTRATASGGAGQDVFRIGDLLNGGIVTITDFAVGDAGDSLDVTAILQSRTGWNATANPVATNHLRIVQNGANTDFYWTAAGTGTGTRFAILQNVTASSLTAYNIGFPLGGGALTGQTIDGNTGADTLTGAAGPDVIHGLDGSDTLNGGGGNDMLYGDGDGDVLDGGSGNDDLFGGSGNDTLLYRTGGNDRLYGEDGDDMLIAESDLLFPATVKTVLLDGGIGNDYFVIRQSATSVTALGGADADIFDVRSNATLTGGSGQDVFRFGDIGTSSAITITDFVTGDAGDRLEVEALLRARTDWDGVTNPFASGHIWVIRHGNDALLQYDPTGSVDGSDYEPIAILQNVDPAALTAYNLGGFIRSGPPDPTVSLGYAASLGENAGAVTLNLNFLYASRVTTTATFALNPATTAVLTTDFTANLALRNFSFYFLPVGLQVTTLLNLATVDDLVDRGIRTIAIDVTVAGQVFANGSDTDTIVISLTDNDGTAGDDVIVLAPGSNRVGGSGGNDYIRADRSANTGTYLDGGAGNDTLVYGATMYGRTGNDTYLAGGFIFESVGEGYDTVFAENNTTLQAGQEIEELAANAPASTLALNLTGNEFANLIVGNAGVNLISGGTGGGDRMYGLGGDDTYVVDHATDQVFESVGEGYDVVFALASHSLRAGAEVEEMVANYPTLPGRLDLTGNEYANALFGNAGVNVLNGGSGGGDRLYGYAGNDFYLVDDQSDLVFENAAGGYDTVYTLSSYRLAAGQSIEELTANLPSSTASLDLTGNEFANALYGNAGANRLAGGDGSDTLTGYAGADLFVFDTTLGNGGVDRIVDFDVGTDKIALDDAMFGGMTSLSASAFVTGSAAADADDRIIYDSVTGALYFDPDGNGAASAVQFATLGTGLALTAADFVII